MATLRVFLFIPVALDVPIPDEIDGADGGFIDAAITYANSHLPAFAQSIVVTSDPSLFPDEYHAQPALSLLSGWEISEAGPPVLRNSEDEDEDDSSYQLNNDDDDLDEDDSDEE